MMRDIVYLDHAEDRDGEDGEVKLDERAMHKARYEALARSPMSQMTGFEEGYRAGWNAHAAGSSGWKRESETSDAAS